MREKCSVGVYPRRTPTIKVGATVFMDNTIGIYIHIPFCVKKCPYCDFNSVADANIPDNAYTVTMLKELAARIEGEPPLAHKTLESIYIGGGTASLISPHNIKKLVHGIRKTFSDASPQEITLEINPGTVTKDSLAAFKDAGINRLSIGIQSFNDKTLKTLGRIHSAKDAVKCYEYAKMAGFDNIGIDLIFGIPDQSTDEWERDLKKAVALKPEHISAYNLTIEKGTPFFELQKKGRLALPSEEEQVLMYELAIDKLEEAGYKHYEISNFSLTGFESRHNMRYWSHKDYIGLGAGAHSYASLPDWGIRQWNEPEPASYMRQVNETGRAIAGEERLTKKEALEEGIFLGLRRAAGINTDWFFKRFNMPLKDLYSSKIDELKTKGLLREDNAGSLILTRKGLLLSNEVISEFI
ncbi:MAG: radical SAM family heme chaperone HemW [Deltaproteobacteria bacterium]|nr:radical SAM family heme chaperone HemW [Deltaproteobacteria bacterium]